MSYQAVRSQSRKAWAAALSTAKNTNSGIWQAQRTHIKSQSDVFMASGLYDSGLRFVNICLLTLITAVLFLSAQAFGQTQGNAISLIDSYSSAGNNPALVCGTGDNCVQYPEALASNDVLVIAAAQENASCSVGVSDPPWTFSSSLGNAITSQTQVTTGANGHMQMACEDVTIPGTDQITVTGLNNTTGCASSFTVSRFKNASCTLDGSLVNGTTSAGSGAQSGSTSITTAVNGDVLVTAAVPVFGPQGAVRTDGTTAQYSTYGGGNNFGFADVLEEYAVTGNLGTYSMGVAICCSGSGSQQGYIQTIALKPRTTIAIGDTVLPDAAASVAYSAQLHCVGGTVAPTYALASGSFPSGISLNTATGLISGSTSSTGTSTLGVTCTGGSTSPTQTLTLKVGAGFNSIVVKSSTTFSGDIQPSTQPVSAACGDLIVLGVNGADTHHAIGWISATAGLNNFWSDSFGSPVQRFITNGGFTAAPMIYYIFGPLPTSGSDVISFANNGGGSSGLPPILVQVVSGAQGVLDVGTLKTSTVNPVATIAQSLTTLVPNEYVLASTVVDDIAAGISFAAPFSLIASGNDGGFGTKSFASANVAAASSVTATSTITGSPATATTLLMALRPALPGACSFTGAGEKKRRSMN